jgi:enterochelin esterase-like enzyme
MNIYSARLLLWPLVLFASLVQQTGAAAEQRLRFRVTVDRELAPQPVSGRLLIFMATNTAAMDTIQTDWTKPRAVWCCAKEVEAWTANKTIEVDPDELAFPEAFSRAPESNYQIMALLDTDHSYASSGQGPGDLHSAVARVKQLKPTETKPVELALTRRVPDRARRQDSDSVKLVTLRSDLLSAFWGRPTEVRAGVRLPPSYQKDSSRRYPTVYVVHGFGGSYTRAWTASDGKEMAAGTLPEMIYVFLDANCPMGHHVFADSVNNGPWCKALTAEFIPHLERTFRMDAKPEGRLLTGHSSGGWSTLWLQVNYPDIFGGTWSTSPDPVDFRNWTGPDLTKTPSDNFYFKPDGSTRWLIRFNGKETVTVQDYARWEMVLGDYGGQLASFDAVFSPRGEDGRPMPMFDRGTGAIDPFVQKAWEHYDISRLLKENWLALGPKLKGKIHVTVGTLDNIHLEESVYLLRDRLKELGSDAQLTFLEGKDHMNLYDNQLGKRIAWEMYQVARPGAGITETINR